MTDVRVAPAFWLPGLAVKISFEADPAWNTTEPPLFTTGVAMESVFVSAWVEDSVQVDTPFASPTEHAP